MTTEQFQTNIVSFEIVKNEWDADRLIKALQSANILVKKIGSNKIRMVTHYQVSSTDVEQVIKCFQTILE